MGSSIAEESEVAEVEEREKEDRKMLIKRRRLLNLISLLSPTTEKKEKELKTGTLPFPTAPSVYLPSQESLIVSASTRSLNPPPNLLLAPFDNNHYHDTSHADSSLVKSGLSRGKGMGRSTSTGVNRASQRPFVGAGRGCLLTAPGALTFRGSWYTGKAKVVVESKQNPNIALRVFRWNLWGLFHTLHPLVVLFSID